MNPKIVFLTGTRADFGKMKSLIKTSHECGLEVSVIATGMHMLKKYGFTFNEVSAFGYGEVLNFSNSNSEDTQDEILAKSIQGISNLCKQINPDFIVVHGDRLEALAGAIVGNFNHVRVIHIEGGEISGTVDEILRHSISKLSHIHLVSNEKAKLRLIQMGESSQSIFLLGSPEVDIFTSGNLPNIDEVKKYYEIFFEEYCIFIFHPVFYELAKLSSDVQTIVNFLKSSANNWVVVLPNNDPGSNLIIEGYKEISALQNIKIISSMRFEYFVSLLRESKLVAGNSSVGVREAPYFGIPSINIGSRQRGRSAAPSIKNVECLLEPLKTAEIESLSQPRVMTDYFGRGDASAQFKSLLLSSRFDQISLEKTFFDAPNPALDED